MIRSLRVDWMGKRARPGMRARGNACRWATIRCSGLVALVLAAGPAFATAQARDKPVLATDSAAARAALALDSARAARGAWVTDSTRAARATESLLASLAADSARTVLAAQLMDSLLVVYADWSNSTAPDAVDRDALAGTATRLPRTAPRAPYFSRQQLNHRRVLEARLEKGDEVKKLFLERGLPYPAAEVFLRIFKRERILEVWARPDEQDTFTLLKVYPICALAGQFGPKRMQGDGQTPEGIYFIDGFNPASDHFLSLHIDYPNKSDRILSPGTPGNGIYIHGGCRTEGCLAVTDDAIKELYWLAVEARNVGQNRIPVHIFPTRMTDQELNQMSRVFDPRAQLRGFWANLRPMYEYFEQHRKLPLVTIDDNGRYRLMPQLGKPAGEE